MSNFSAHHYLEAPLSPSNRRFDSHYSNNTKRLFKILAQQMNKNDAHLWSDGYEKIGRSLRPEQMEINLLGFAYEKTSQKRLVFKSLRMEPLQVNSSYSFIEPFKANVIIVAEVTTGIIDFHEEDLIQLEEVLFFLFLYLCTF